ncbi:ribonuclease CAF1 [Pelomyxa schiedti]|nr:ribonuclease CAF1 [Pelomyxa schiedti]
MQTPKREVTEIMGTAAVDPPLVTVSSPASESEQATTASCHSTELPDATETRHKRDSNIGGDCDTGSNTTSSTCVTTTETTTKRDTDITADLWAHGPNGSGPTDAFCAALAIPPDLLRSEVSTSTSESVGAGSTANPGFEVESGATAVAVVTPPVSVCVDNFESMWNEIVLTTGHATFVAIDTEFTGFGNLKAEKLIPDRYLSFRSVAQSQSLVQIGISAFSRVPQPSATAKPATNPSVRQSSQVKRQIAPLSPNQEIGGKLKGEGVKAAPKRTCTSTGAVRYNVHTYELLVCKQDLFEVTPSSMKFLVETGFDLNNLFLKGIPFWGGGKEEPAEPSVPKSHKTLVTLFAHILRQQKIPIILHNGSLDLVFLYQNFIGELPPDLKQFSDSISNDFPPLYDTKWIAEKSFNETASYLQYLFAKCERMSKSRGAVICTPLFLSFKRNLSTTQTPHKLKCCNAYAATGHCRWNKSCRYSHDINQILDAEESRSALHQQPCQPQKKRTRFAPQHSIPAVSTVVTAATESPPEDPKEELSLPTTSPTPNPIDTTADTQDTPEQPSTDHASTLPTHPTATETATTSPPSPPSQTALPLPTALVASPPPVVQDGSPQTSTPSNSNIGMHHAGCDAFATGFVYASYLSRLGNGMLNHKNKIYLPGKQQPLYLEKSAYGN